MAIHDLATALRIEQRQDEPELPNGAIMRFLRCLFFLGLSG